MDKGYFALFLRTGAPVFYLLAVCSEPTETEKL